MRPHVLLDVDGVLADFVGAVLRKVDGMTMEHLPTADEITTMEIFDSLPESVRKWKEVVYEDMGKEGKCLSLAVYPGAKEGVARLREIADVTIVTAPLRGSPTWAYEREAWLWRHFGIERHDIIHTSKKQLVRGDVFIDDHAGHVASWKRHHPHGAAACWARPYNHDSVGHACRTNDWDTLLDWLSGELATHRSGG